MSMRSTMAPFAEAGAAILERLGFSPNGVTTLALLIGLLNAALFVYTREPLLFALVGFVSAPLDLLDGTLARRLGRSTRFGAYYDAMCDRIYDAAGVLAAGLVTGHWVPLLLAIVGADAISYAKARAAMEVPIGNDRWPDLMERAPRMLVFIAGIIMLGIWPDVRIFGKDLFFWDLLVLDLLIWFTVVQRFLRARRFLRAAEHEL